VIVPPPTVTVLPEVIQLTPTAAETPTPSAEESPELLLDWLEADEVWLLALGVEPAPEVFGLFFTWSLDC
jgi:hypothetical protein